MFKKSWWFAWFLVALFFALSIWARVWYGRMLGGQEAHNFIIDIWVAGIFLMVPTVVIGPLAGVVPWRGQPYWRRVLNRLPFITAGIALLVLAIASIALLLTPRMRQNEAVLGWACAAAFLSMWIDKGMGLIIAGFVPSPLKEIHEYSPTAPELAITLGVYAIGALVLTVLYKLALAVRGEIAQ